MAFQKGNKLAGSRKGIPNKSTASVKEALHEVYAKRGGDKALLAWSQENPTEFYKLWGRMLPQEVSGPDGGEIPFAGIVREIVRAKASASNS